MPTIDTRITKVEQDTATGWFRIHTSDERVKRVDTNRAELAQEAAGFKRNDAPVRLEFTEKESTNINPHTNRPYLNRYYESATALSANGASGDGIERVSPTRPATNPDEAWRICLAAGAKLAVAAAARVEGLETLAAQKAMAQRWAEFFYFSKPPDAPSNGAEQLQVARAAQPQPQQQWADVQLGDEPPPHSDEEIPF
jgi:hypothetical protein